tara:strand:+ start:202 stop:537 length:336 start_codon:yes stop_codon:yes gene_type:complete
MPNFKKGNKTGSGRPKGSKNKSTQQIKNAFQALLSNSLPQLIEDVNEMEPKDRANFLLKLSDKILPSLKSVDSVVETKGIQQLGFNLNYTPHGEEGDTDQQQISDSKAIEE